jgi:hypothetical protein
MWTIYIQSGTAHMMNFYSARSVKHSLAVFAVGLASCGGGGGDSASTGGQLSGSVTLLASAEVATPSSISATLPAGASGQPSCNVDSGQLPPGMALAGCTLQGTPTVVGTYASALTLTIPGYSGSTRVDATVTIGGPVLGPSSSPTSTGLRLNVPVVGLSIFGLYSTAPVFAIRPTDTLVYRIVSGSLPSGLVFDATTGQISGTPTQSGSFPLTVQATLTRGNAIYELASYVTPGVVVLSF